MFAYFTCFCICVNDVELYHSLKRYAFFQREKIEQNHFGSVLLLLLSHCSFHITKNRISFWYFLLGFYKVTMTVTYNLLTSSKKVMSVPIYLENLTFLTFFCLLCILFYFKKWRSFSFYLFSQDYFIDLISIYCLIFVNEMFYILSIFYKHSLCLHLHYSYFYSLRSTCFVTQNYIFEWTVLQFETSKVFLIKKSILMFFDGVKYYPNPPKISRKLLKFS